MSAANLNRVCVSSWSFHTLFEEKPAALDALDFPEMIADRYHVHNVEMVLPHMGEVTPALARSFKDQLRRAHSRLVNMPLDYAQLWNTPGISSTDSAEREAAIELYRQGIDIAHQLGSASVRCDPGKVDVNDPSITINSYTRLAAYAQSHGIGLVVENHGDIAKHPDVLVGILNAAGICALPDFGNFPDQETRDRGLKLLFSVAGDVAHAKLREGFDFARCVRIANEAGFTGVFSVEASGRGDPYSEVQTIVDALVEALYEPA